MKRRWFEPFTFSDKSTALPMEPTDVELATGGEDLPLPKAG